MTFQELKSRTHTKKVEYIFLEKKCNLYLWNMKLKLIGDLYWQMSIKQSIMQTSSHRLIKLRILIQEFS